MGHVLVAVTRHPHGRLAAVLDDIDFTNSAIADELRVLADRIR